MLKFRSPTTVAKEVGAYTHAIEVPPNARWLYISGQVGLAPDGSLGKTAGEQADWVFRNIAAILADAGMTMQDVVKMTTFVTDAAHLPEVRAARERHRAGAKPTSTLVIVKGLAAPEYLVEVEAVAAKA